MKRLFRPLAHLDLEAGMIDEVTSQTTRRVLNDSKDIQRLNY